MNSFKIMIAIDNKLVSDDIVEKQFVCDLVKCKGGCCEDGDAGAPLELNELDELIHSYEIVKPYLTEAGIRSIETHGKYVYDREFGWVTPTIKGAMCAYGFKDENGIIKCGIEKAYNEGKINWKKPISCHLFPIRVNKSKEDEDLEYLNYEPRPDLCRAACKLGKHLQVPVYVFLKESIIRKYGEDFYNALEAAAQYAEANK
ncbi:MAG: DUF3109 family protein [Parafilimonas sp.]